MNELENIRCDFDVKKSVEENTVENFNKAMKKVKDYFYKAFFAFDVEIARYGYEYLPDKLTENLLAEIESKIGENLKIQISQKVIDFLAEEKEIESFKAEWKAA